MTERVWSQGVVSGRSGIPVIGLKNLPIGSNTMPVAGQAASGRLGRAPSGPVALTGRIFEASSFGARAFVAQAAPARG